MTVSTRIAVGPEASSTPAYDVLIGPGVLDQLPRMIGEDARQVLVLHPRALRRTAGTVHGDLAAAGYRTQLFEVPDGEDAKTVEVLSATWRLLAQAGFTRTDVLVGLGGGTVTDLAGYAAASWLRGVPVVLVPTTLLGMVDAAVGGKTGINVPEGKNLIGAFHPPRGVLADLTALRTLPQPDLVAGLAEAVKCGFIADPRILELIEADPAAAVDWESPVLRELVERSVTVKARVVTEDLKEVRLREVLNYGHTFGHAIEQVERFRPRHGEAVSAGLVYAATVGRLAGITEPGLVARHRSVLGMLGLPTAFRQDCWPALLQAMRRDKKNRGDVLRLVVLAGLADPVRLEGPSPDLLEQAYRQLAG